MRSRCTAAIGLALVILAVLVPSVYSYWLNTRTFVAYEMPVSLAPGEIHSQEFSVNLAGWYQISTNVEQAFQFRFSCGFGGRPPLLRARIKIYRDGKLLRQFEGADNFLGNFYAEPRKRYRFETEILTDARCLDEGRPRILVETTSIPYLQLLVVLAGTGVFLFLCGVGLLLFAAFSCCGTSATLSDERLNADALRYHYYPQRRKLPLQARFTQPPSFGITCATLLGGALLPVFLTMLRDSHSVGIRVKLIRPDALPSPTDMRPAAPTIRVEGSGFNGPSRIYLNEKLVRPEDLGPALKEQLKSRGDWYVYVEAGSDVAWQDVAQVIATIQGMGAKAVLLTSKSALP
ncbi:MAG TPA: biopolymer transporter ExbD [Verrucomicrobiae bacterium]|nr:biopolymer transporter ExbD [Verrucomicrobiae bacterium]